MTTSYAQLKKRRDARKSRPRSHNSTIAVSRAPAKRSAPMKSKGRVRPSNPARRKKEFQRAYESEARVQWMAALGCLICGQRPCDNAHAKGDGASRKGDAKQVVPLCRSHHRELHQRGVLTFEAYYAVRLEEAAASFARIWDADQEAAQRAVSQIEQRGKEYGRLPESR